MEELQTRQKGKVANFMLKIFVQGESFKICFEQVNGENKVCSFKNAKSTD